MTIDETVAERAQRLLDDFVNAYDLAYGAAASAHALSGAQLCALSAMDEPQPMSALAARLGCEASNVTQIVRRLEARGLATREVDHTDRRVKHVGITAAGRRARSRALRDFTFARKALDRLTEAEQRCLVDLVGKMLAPPA